MDLNSNGLLPKIILIFKMLFAIFVIIFFLLNYLLKSSLLLKEYNRITFNDGANEQAKVSTLLKLTPIKWKNNTTYLTLNSTDYATLLNITDFRFLLNQQKKCTDSDDIFMLIFIHSATDNFAKRETIRNTWGNLKNFHNTNNQIRIIFLLGETEDKIVGDGVTKENDRHGDIVQGNFLDTYRNMTYKHVMGLKWVPYFCSNARYVFKADDDIFVDVFQLIYYLKGTFGDSPRNLIACYVNFVSWVNRSYRNKWRVSYAEYSKHYYPKYCAGWSIIMSRDAVFALYRISRNRKYFWIDDVFIYGMLAQDLNLNHTDISKCAPNDYAKVDRWLRSERLSLPPLFGPPNCEINQIVQLWNKTILYYQNNFNYTFS